MFWKIMHKLYLLIVRPFTVSNILDSSRKLDQMRKEIKELPPILVGLLKDSLRYHVEPYDDFAGVRTDCIGQSGNYFWKLNYNNVSFLGVMLFYKNDLQFSYEFGKPFKLENSKIGEVHGRLQDLINLMLENYPSLEHELKHFVKDHKRILN